METVLNVNGMSCRHCVNAINKAVGALDGVRGVMVDLNNKIVKVEYDEGKISLDTIKNEIEDQGYDVG
ncbi:MAG: Copper chaperone CopZ [Firmicutes bacterium ADurb.Bin182]|nr:MAG: Copper chaperone CopZ [Firmicutes bacterium ADurb.Bin182]